MRTESSILTALFLVAVGSGCADLQQQIVSAARQPGDQIHTTPEVLWKERMCNEPERPFVKVETLEVLPEKIKPGGRLNYRLVYAMCPTNKFSESLAGYMTRRLIYKGQAVAQNTKNDFEMKAGRWAVDAFFTLPQNTPLGVYALEVEVVMPNGRSQRLARSFVVSDEFYLSGE